MFFPQYPYINLNDLNLDWLLKHMKELLAALADLEHWKSEHEEEYNELKKLYDDILSGHFPEEMKTALNEWVVNNAVDIIGELIKSVFFNLTDDGYLVAYIPDSWSDIVFGTTGLDVFPVGVDYGHLTLNY